MIYGLAKENSNKRITALFLEGKKLSEYMTLKHLKVDNAKNQEVIENIDLLWIKR